MNKKKGIIAVCIIVLIAIIAGVGYYQSNPMNKIEVLSSEIEAMEPIDLTTCIKVKDQYASEYTVAPEGESLRTFETPGTETVAYILEHDGKAGRLDVDFNIVDTTAPKIKVKKTFLQEGKDLALNKLVRIKDAVDGKINSSEVSVEGDVNTEKPGKYPIKLSVADALGNVSTKTVNVIVADKEAFMGKIDGLWLNKCKSAAQASATAHAVGLTDVSMTQFTARNGECYMTTMGDIYGFYDGGKVPDINNKKINFTYIAPDLSKAKGKVDGKKIVFKLKNIDDGHFFFKCGKYKNNCADTGFDTLEEMNAYLSGGN